MKKIIATVLAMVMALALCTTAFAASAYNAGTATTTKDGFSYELKNGAGAYKDNVATFFVHETNTKTNAVSVSVAMVKVTKGQADYTIVNDSVITYLAVAETFGTDYDDTAKAAVTVDELKNCGDLKALNDAKLYIGDSDGVLYVAATAGTKTLLVGDVLVKVNEATTANYEEQAHKYVVTTAKKDGKDVVTGLSCSACNKTFEFKDNSDDAIVAFGLGNFDKVTVSVDSKNFELYVKAADATTSTGSSSTTTTSPKTFDAGIAMYVGMALTSVAGSAVVIGKKKEF